MPEAIVPLSVSVKLTTEEELKCVHPLPVMVTGTIVPAAPAPGDTTATAAAGFVAVADPVSDAVSGEPPGAESVTVSVPVRVVGLIELGVKFT
jgi:hypothetical protein